MAEGTKTPWHIWLVGVISVLWNGFGATDFAMTVTLGEQWLRIMKMTEAQITYLDTYPTWMYVVWFAGTWGAIIGSVLLLLRLRWAVHAFLVSLIGFLLSLVYLYLMSNASDVMGGVEVMNAVILAGCVFFLWYTSTMSKRGVLH